MRVLLLLCIWGQLLVQKWNYLHQISEFIWISPLHMACKFTH